MNSTAEIANALTITIPVCIAYVRLQLIPDGNQVVMTITTEGR